MYRLLFSILFIASIYLISSFLSGDESLNNLTTEQIQQSLNSKSNILGQKVNRNNVLYTLDGTEVKLSEFYGKPLVIMFWAPWCKACKLQIPEIHKVQIDYPDVNFAYIAVSTNNKAVYEWQKTNSTQELKIYYKGWKQGESILTGNSLPLTYVIDSEGTVVEEKTGFDMTKKLDYLIERLKILSSI
jgi:thiol-disulfide isomerase/thioredoxin